MSQAKEIFDAAFGKNLSKAHRSPPYEKGIMDELKLKTGKILGLPARYHPGSPEFAAYRAGVLKGRALWELELTKKTLEAGNGGH
ncbi:hypothetical protein DRQ53_08000 [bacterium]|nr:MAG: hypothetical protein DRQ53_08000 [bacterium]